MSRDSVILEEVGRAIRMRRRARDLKLFWDLDCSPVGFRARLKVMDILKQLKMK